MEHNRINRIAILNKLVVSLMPVKASLSFAVISIALMMIWTPKIVSAHEDGLAIPVIAITSEQPSNLIRIYRVQITDEDSGDPVVGVNGQIRATMMDDSMEVNGALIPDARPGTYKAQLDYPMAAEWQGIVQISGDNVRSAEKSFVENIELEPLKSADTPPLSDNVQVGSTSGSKDPATAEVIGSTRTSLNSGDYINILISYLHIIAAIVWVGGHVFFFLVIRPSLQAFDPSARIRSFRSVIRRMSQTLGVAFVTLIVTGLFNVSRNAPATIAELNDVPFGIIYLDVFRIKLLFVLAAFLIGAYTAFVLQRSSAAVSRSQGTLTESGEPKDKNADLDAFEHWKKRVLRMTDLNLIAGLYIVFLANLLGYIHHFIHSA